MAKAKVPAEPEITVDIRNQFNVVSGENLPNHSTSMRGLGSFVRATIPPIGLRTREEVYRLCAHLLGHAQALPNDPELPEEKMPGWHEILDAVLEDMGVEIDEDRDNEDDE